MNAISPSRLKRLPRLVLLAAALQLAGCATPALAPATYEPVADMSLSDAQLMSRSKQRDMSPDAAMDEVKRFVASLPSDYDQPITLLHGVLPEYPRDALMEGVTGVVIVRFVIDEGGHVESVVAIQSPDQRLSNACIQAILQWQFAPFTRGGKPTRAVFVEKFPFRL